MLLTEYLSGLLGSVDEYAKTDLILSSELMIDARTEKIGLVKGSITFLDNSKLFSTEYLDLRFKTEKLSYAFHYQDMNGTMIFRYDNAAHRPNLPFADHKHIKTDIVEASIPELSGVVEEVIAFLIQRAEST